MKKSSAILLLGVEIRLGRVANVERVVERAQPERQVQATDAQAIVARVAEAIAHPEFARDEVVLRSRRDGGSEPAFVREAERAGGLDLAEIERSARVRLHPDVPGRARAPVRLFVQDEVALAEAEVHRVR